MFDPWFLKQKKCGTELNVLPLILRLPKNLENTVKNNHNINSLLFNVLTLFI